MAFLELRVHSTKKKLSVDSVLSLVYRNLNETGKKKLEFLSQTVKLLSVENTNFNLIIQY